MQRKTVDLKFPAKKRPDIEADIDPVDCRDFLVFFVHAQFIQNYLGMWKQRNTHRSCQGHVHAGRFGCTFFQLLFVRLHIKNLQSDHNDHYGNNDHATDE